MKRLDGFKWKNWRLLIAEQGVRAYGGEIELRITDYE